MVGEISTFRWNYNFCMVRSLRKTDCHNSKWRLPPTSAEADAPRLGSSEYHLSSNSEFEEVQVCGLRSPIDSIAYSISLCSFLVGLSFRVVIFVTFRLLGHIRPASDLRRSILDCDLRLDKNRVRCGLGSLAVVTWK